MRGNSTIAALLLALGAFAASAPGAQAEHPVQVTLDGEPLTFREPPVVEDGVTWVPFRPLFEAFGLEVAWDEATGTIAGEREGWAVRLQLEQKRAVVNDKPVVLQQAPRVVNGSALVPLRFVGEAVRADVRWDDAARTIRISSRLYEGETKGGVPHGVGTLYEWGAELYRGEFRDGAFHGEGTYYGLGGGVRYEGEFVDGTMQGRGKLYRADGSLWYDAEFADGAVHGAGTVYFPIGHRLEVTFLNGNPHGQGVYYYGDGTVRFRGSYRDGLRNGRGTSYYANGNVMHDGEYVDSRLVKGKLYYDDGTLWYEGEFGDDTKPDGEGVEYDRDGNVTHRGHFRYGEPAKEGEEAP